MIQASQLRPGMVIIFEGNHCRVMVVQHVTPGNLRGFVQAKLRNLRSGNSFEHRFGATEKVERGILDEEMEDLHSDGSDHHFTNTENSEQVALSDEELGD